MGKAATDNYSDLFKVLSQFSGTDFSKYKASTIERRIQKRMGLLNISDLESYKKYLNKNSEELSILYNSILIGVTEFFRDEDAFEGIKNCLQDIILKKHKGDNIRIWSVGCSTGAEPYSIAILLNEILKDQVQDYRIQIFASDIDDKAINFARKGNYPHSKLENIDPQIINKYFEKTEDGNYEVKKKLKQLILFAKHDITTDPPFVKIDLIICRNLLIYFNQQLQKECISLFHYSLSQDGYLFLGKSEHIGNHTSHFFAIDVKNKIYKKNNEVSTALDASFRFKTTKYFVREKKTEPILKTSVKDLAKEVLYNTYDHPFAIVNEKLEIEDIHGSLRLYLEVQGPLQKGNILEMINPELKPELRSLIFKVDKSGIPAISNKIKFFLFGENHYVKLQVKPVINEKLQRQYYIIIFAKQEHIENGNIPNFADKAAEVRITELEQELEVAREQLQTFTEELEASYEEMQLLNEELQSSNEELQSSNEEMETSNEELHSANEELQSTNLELRKLNDMLLEKEGQLIDAEQKWTSLYKHSNSIILIVDKVCKITSVNRLDNFGVSEEAILGNDIVDFLDLKNPKKVKATLAEVIRKRKNKGIESVSKTTGCTYSFNFIPLVKNKEVDGIIVFANDITEKVQYEQMLYFLNKSSKELMSSLNLEESIQKIKNIIVPDLADWFTIDLLKNNTVELFVVAHKNPEKVEWAREHRLKNPIDLTAPTGAAKVLRTGESDYYPNIPDELLVQTAKSEEELKLTRSIGFHSVMIVPIKVKDKPIGVVNFIATKDSNRHYTEYDLLVAEEFGKLLGVTLENIKLFNESEIKLKEKIEAERALIASESQLKLITDGIPVGVAYFGKDYKYKFSNQAYADLVGKEKSNIYDKTLAEILTESIFKTLKPLIDKALKGEKVHFQKKVQFPGIGYRIVDGNYIPDIDETGNVGGVVVLINDITIEKINEEKLKQSEVKFRTMVEAVPHIAWTADKDGNVNFLNNRWTDYTGKTIEESLGSNWIESYHPEDRIKAAEVWGKTLKTKGPYEFEGRLFHIEKGEYCWNVVKAIPVMGLKDEVLLWVGTCTDINEQKLMVEKKDEFLSIASHELKTPLTSIKAYLQLLEADLPDQNSNLAIFTKKANYYSNILNNLIADLLDVSKIQAGKLELNVNEFNFNDLIEESVLDFKFSYPGYNIEVNKKEDVTIKADKNRLEQVIQNLLSNAVKYSPDSNKIIMTAENLEKEVVLHVQDFGVGISKENKERVFDKYFRVSDNSFEFSGLGVGLYIVSEIVKRHNGRIWVNSEVGKGTTFSFAIPKK